jgi:hypothetical protein
MLGQVSFLNDEEFFQTTVKFAVKFSNWEIFLRTWHFDAIASIPSLGMQQEGNHISQIIFIMDGHNRAGYPRALAADEPFHKPVCPPYRQRIPDNRAQLSLRPVALALADLVVHWRVFL